MQEINKEILIYLNSLSHNSVIESLVTTFVDLPILFLPIFLLWLWIYYSYSKKDNVKWKLKLLYIFYSTIIAIIISLIIQQIIYVDRPETVIDWTWKLLLKHIPDASFPSDHASVSFAFLFWLFFSWFKKTWVVFAIFAILMNVSRVIAWVHWPFDVLAWFIVWIIWAIISFKVLKNIELVKWFNNFIINLLSKIKL